MSIQDDTSIKQTIGDSSSKPLADQEVDPPRRGETKGLAGCIKRYIKNSLEVKEKDFIKYLNSDDTLSNHNLTCDNRREVTIALDCMGGDNAPNAALEAIALVIKSNLNVRFILFGDTKKINVLLNQQAQCCPMLIQKCSVRHCGSVISGGEKPSIALRKGRDSSMRCAIDAVKSGEADACISAGNTGALMAMSKVVLRPMEEIDRPAIIASMPNAKGKISLLLDMGANLLCDAQNLCQFAVMGRAFAKVALGIEEPTVGLLNIGTEEIKGNEELKKAYAILKNSRFRDHFYGYVEGDDILKGTVDVVVTDGFTGNVALKSIEGAAKLLSGLMKRAFGKSLWAKIGALFAFGALKKVAQEADPRFYNGGMFLGLNGISLKSHGNSDRISFANSIKVAALLSRNHINVAIKDELQNIDLDSLQTEDATATV